LRTQDLTCHDVLEPEFLCGSERSRLSPARPSAKREARGRSSKRALFLLGCALGLGPGRDEELTCRDVLAPGFLCGNERPHSASEPK
jgi:hypothetical protein